LEDRITRTIDIISKLREENLQIRNENAELITRIQEQEKNINRLRQRCDELSENQNQSGELIEKIERATARIKSIISRLDELEPLA